MPKMLGPYDLSQFLPAAYGMIVNVQTKIPAPGKAPGSAGVGIVILAAMPTYRGEEYVSTLLASGYAVPEARTIATLRGSALLYVPGGLYQGMTLPGVEVSYDPARAGQTLFLLGAGLATNLRIGSSEYRDAARSATAMLGHHAFLFLEPALPPESRAARFSAGLPGEQVIN